MPNFILMTGFSWKLIWLCFWNTLRNALFSIFAFFFLKIHIFRFFTGIAKSGQITLFSLSIAYLYVFFFYQRVGQVSSEPIWLLGAYFEKYILYEKSFRVVRARYITLRTQSKTKFRLIEKTKVGSYWKNFSKPRKKVQERGKTVVKEPNYFKSKSYVKSERLEYVIVGRGNLFWKEWLRKTANFNNMLNFRWETTHNLEFQSGTGRDWNFSKFV